MPAAGVSSVAAITGSPVPAGSSLVSVVGALSMPPGAFPVSGGIVNNFIHVIHSFDCKCILLINGLSIYLSISIYLGCPMTDGDGLSTSEHKKMHRSRRNVLTLKYFTSRELTVSFVTFGPKTLRDQPAF